MDLFEDDDPEFNKGIARRLGEYFLEMQRLCTNEGAAFGRWLTASLLAVNGAGALAILNVLDKLSHPYLSAGLFVSGVVAALIAGVLGQWAYHAASEGMGKAIGRVMLIAETGLADEEDEKELNSFGAVVERHSFWQPASGWLSGILFVGACLATGLDRPAVNRTCQRLESAMLSARGAIPEAPAKFQALGCRPQN